MKDLAVLMLIGNEEQAQHGQIRSPVLEASINGKRETPPN
jgi:hypothetical protein